MTSLQKKLIFKKFRVGKLIHKSEISLIYDGKNELTQEPVAMKFEKSGGKFDLLESEAYFLYLLKGIGIPKIISYGKISNYRILIEELLGQSVYSLLNKKINPKNKLNDICLIAIQSINRLEYIHSKNIIHRDIKPFNFVFGRTDPNLIYLLDFGISRKYKSSRTGNHIRFRRLESINGSFRYMSINSNRGYEQSRRDDLESLGYMLVYLMKKNLPWLSIEKEKIVKKAKFIKICKTKVKTKPEELCLGLPKEFSMYINYCQKLEFEQDPNYNYLRNLFIEVIQRNEKLTDIRLINYIHFSWLKNDTKKINTPPDQIINASSSIGNLKDENNINGRGNFRIRIFRQIKDSINRAKSQEIPNVRNSNFFNFNLKNINIILNKLDENNFDNKKKEKSINTDTYKYRINLNNKKTTIKRTILKKKINSKEKSKQNGPLKYNNIPTGKERFNTFGNNNDKNNNNSRVLYSNLEKMKLFKILSTKKNIPFNSSVNYSLDNSLNIKNFRYRTLGERERERERERGIYKNNNFNIKRNNFSIEYEYKNKYLFNRNSMTKGTSDTILNRSSIVNVNRLFLLRNSNTYNMYQNYNNFY